MLEIISVTLTAITFLITLTVTEIISHFSEWGHHSLFHNSKGSFSSKLTWTVLPLDTFSIVAQEVSVLALTAFPQAHSVTRLFAVRKPTGSRTRVRASFKGGVATATKTV